jgi:hypothetical protein
MNSGSLVLLAGSLAFVGSFKQANGFPPNGYAVIGGTVALVFIFSLADKTSIEPIVKGLAGLMLLASVFVYVPGLAKTAKTKTSKGK